MPSRTRIILLTCIVLLSVASYAQKPVITGVSPISSPMGIEVVIIGSGFDVDPANLVVRFGATKAFIKEAKENLIAVRVPPGSTTRTISVTNRISGLTGYSIRPHLLSFSGSTFDETAFSSPLDYSSESKLYDVVMEDFDNDNKIDIATANDDSQLINVYHNTSTPGAVSFTTQTITISSETINVNSRDLDGDGRPELLVSKSGNPGDRVYYMKNNSTPGTISFASPQVLLIDGNIARRIEIEDLDRDGLPEVIVANQSNNRISYFKNTSTPGNISFATVSSIEITDATNASVQSAGLTVSDLNGDGFPDIATTQFLDKDIYITPNESRIGLIDFGTTIKISSPGNMSFIKAADINMDGKNDLIISKLQQNQLGILLNNSTNQEFSFSSEVVYPVNDRPWGIAIGDLNGDRKPDVAVASINNADRKLTVLENNTSGGVLGFNTKFVTTPQITRNLQIGDIDTDGKPDIAVTSLATPVYNLTVLRNKNCFEPLMWPNEDQDLCTNAEVTLRATPSRGATYTWKRSDNTILGSGPDPFYTFTPADGTSYGYFVEATTESGDCVTSSNQTTITVSSGVIPNPPTIAEPTPACIGSSTVLTIEPATLLPGATYTWEQPDGTTTVGENLPLTDVTLADAGRYLLSAFDGGCESSIDTAYLEVVSPPAIEIVSGDELIFCDGNSATLSVTNDATYTYQWFRGNTAITGATSATYVATVSGNYTVEVVNAYSCSSISEPATTLAASPPVAQFTVNSTGCVGNTITFNNTSTVQSGINVYYNWNFGDGNTSTEENPTHVYATANSYTTSLSVTYDDATCSSTTNNSITIGEPPIVTIDADVTEFCTGGSAELSIQGTYASILWSTGETTSTITVTTGGTFSVTVTTIDNCEANTSIDITEFNLPVISVDPANPSVELGNSVQLEASGAITYVWDPITGLDDPSIANPLVTPEETTVYTVTGTDANNCVGTTEVTVTVIVPEPVLIPQLMFSPNGDGINDFWVIENIEDCVDCTLTIFDRSGIKVYEEVNYSQSWNGIFNGQELVEDVYYFVVTMENENITSGSITLIR